MYSLYYFLRLRYVGDNFRGFQYQPGLRTVQSVLTEAFGELFGNEVLVKGCSRTDSGVHANDYCITVLTPEYAPDIPPEKLPFAMKRYLPEDISVYSAEYAPDNFHVRHDVKYKEYLYLVDNSPVPDPFYTRRSWQYLYPLPEESDIIMHNAGQYLVGTHDFSSFMAEGSEVASRVRTIFYINVKKSILKSKLFEIRVAGDGFLYNMVRIIAGTLVDVAAGRKKSEDIPEILKKRDRKYAGMTAPPEGLYLNRVVY